MIPQPSLIIRIVLQLTEALGYNNSIANISKKYLEEKLKRESWDIFKREIVKVKSRNELDGLFRKFFTPAEKILLEKRLAIMRLVELGTSYRNIGRMIDVSPSTISFIKSGFRKKPPVKRKYSLGPPSSAPRNSLLPPPPSYKGTGQWRFAKKRRRYS